VTERLSISMNVFGIDCGNVTLPLGTAAPSTLLRLARGDQELLALDLFGMLADSLTEGAGGEPRVVCDPTAEVHPSSVLEPPCWIGPHAAIGPGAYVRPGTIVGARCRIGWCAELKAAILGDDTVFVHYGYIGNSVIGEGCDLGAGFTIGVQRLDRTSPRLHMPDGTARPTGWEKCGAIIGKNVRAGIGVSVMPGTMISADQIIRPRECIGLPGAEGEK
jgi:NDP-sugar pyrophosphorylase family protein